MFEYKKIIKKYLIFYLISYFLIINIIIQNKRKSFYNIFIIFLFDNFYYQIFFIFNLIKYNFI